MNRTTVAFVSLSVLLVGAGALIAGPLNPPAGPVAATYKTLSDVEPRRAISSLPYTISQSGSYYLTGNLTGVFAQSGITVTTGDVTIDLCGFSLNGGGGNTSGIQADFMSRVTVRNGSIGYWGVNGVRIGEGGTLENLRLHHNVGTGGYATQDCIIERVSAVANGTGILSAGKSTIIDSVANSNSAIGISASDGTTISRCTCGDNGTVGISASSGCEISNCATRGNGTDGIAADWDCNITGNSCTGNGDDGIQVTNFCRVVGNTCNANGPNAAGTGVYLVGTGNRVEDNHVSANHIGVLSNGLGNFIAKNTARGNTSAAFSAQAGNQMAPVIVTPGTNNFTTMTPWSNISY